MQTYDTQFADLYRTSFRVAYRILGNRAESEDVAQDTMAKAYSRWWRVRNEPKRWVSRVSANGAIDVWRKRSRSELTSAELMRAHDGEPVVERLALVEALARLSKRQREVVVLRYLAGYPEADVAAILECSVGSVKTHAHRGIRSLRSSLS